MHAGDQRADQSDVGGAQLETALDGSMWSVFGSPPQPTATVEELAAGARGLREKTGRAIIGLFGGIDECRFKRVVSPGDTLRLEVTMDKLGRRFGRGLGTATVDGQVACQATLSFIIPDASVLR